MSKVKLTPKWQLDAALLSRPVDLTALVSLSRTNPESFGTDNTLQRLISVLLNEKNEKKSDKDTKLDVLNIFCNVARGSRRAKAEVCDALANISEWFDDYIAAEEGDPAKEPQLHKAMVLLLARAWDYKLKTEDVLELTQGNRRIALCTVVGLLEDGETYSTELKQRQKPEQGKLGQWEHELVCQRYEKLLILQISRLLRGFTSPATYFQASEQGEEIELYNIELFSEEITSLLDITLKSRLVEKISVALYDCLMDEELQAEGQDYATESKYTDEDGLRSLDENDHMAVVCVHAFIQNLYFYASQNNEIYRKHMLMDTLLIPRLVLPYLERAVSQAAQLTDRAVAYTDVLDGDQAIAQLAMHNPNLVQAIAASLRTLIIASFRAPATQFVVSLLKRLNPTTRLLQSAGAFCCHHEYIFTLLCLLNVNMGALELSKVDIHEQNSENMMDAYHAHALLHELAVVFSKMNTETQARVYKRVVSSGALPVSRDTPSYVAVMSVLHGGAAGQLDYLKADFVSPEGEGNGEDNIIWDSRAEAKRAAAERMAAYRQSKRDNGIIDDVDDDGDYNGEYETDGHDDELRIMRDQAEYKDADSKDVQADSKQETSSFEIANQARVEAELRIQEAKDSRAESKGGESKGEGYRLLGDLPAFAVANKRDIKVAINLELPSGGSSAIPKLMGREKESNRQEEKSSYDVTGVNKDGIPREFLCAINGHVMKEPVRAMTSNICFEKATIEVWLATRGSICPITHETLERSDLREDDDLRSRIMRYHIQQTTFKQQSNPEDDLYDF